jgi:hypothetical protein
MVNVELEKLTDWIKANKLSLNIKNQNLWYFHPLENNFIIFQILS